MLGPLKEEARKRQLAHLKHQPESIVPPELVERGEGTGEAVHQAAKLVGVGKTVVQDAKAIMEKAESRGRVLQLRLVGPHRNQRGDWCE